MLNTTLAPLLNVPVCADMVSVVVVAVMYSSWELPDPISRPVAALAAEKTGNGAVANAVANVTVNKAPTPAPEPNVKLCLHRRIGAGDRNCQVAVCSGSRSSGYRRR